MARPSYRGSDVTARDRMIEAFWGLLKERPYSKITVSLLTERAEVNRNTFYYHFSCVDDLAHAAVSGNLLPEVFLSLIESFDPAKVSGLLLSPEVEERIRRLALIAGPHGSNELVGVLKETVFEAWCGLMGIERGNLSDKDVFVINFVLGGMVAAYPSMVQIDRLGVSARDMLESGVPQTCFKLINEVAARTRECA